MTGREYLMLMTGDQSGQENDHTDTEEEGLSLIKFTQFVNEIDLQPPWRGRADREMDYYDGNQLDSEVMRRQRELGMPPAIEPLIGSTIDAVLGMEAKSRTDWRVIPDADKSGDDVSEALNHRLNQAERQSGADRANSEAYASQIKVGLGWVEVARSTDPFKYPYRVEHVHRNEIWWDFLSTKPDLSDARYLIRRRWTDLDIAEKMFPDKANLIRMSGINWAGIDLGNLTFDGGMSTDLAMSWNIERGWSVEEQQWRDTYRKRVCLYECWHREWERILVLKSPDGRVVEYDKTNPRHVVVVANGLVKVESAVVSRMKLSWWMGPHKLWEGNSPYRHNNFPYVAFWGKREDRTGVPYGLIRGMMYLQDEVNARTSKMQWMLSAVRTTRTDGVVVADDERFRQEVGRPDADIILDQREMAKPGATFKIERDAELNAQQAQRLVDAREGIKRVGGIYNAFLGQDSDAKSGVAISGLVEQSTQTLADINDNYKYARAQVGDMLLNLIIEDMIGQEHTVLVPGNGLRDDREIVLNQEVEDPDTHLRYLNNDIERAKLKVVLNDVPSTPSFRAQQLSALSEAFKSMPEDYQRVAFPHLMQLMDIPNKQEILEAIKKLGEQPNPEQIQQLIDEAVKEALIEAKVSEAREKLRIEMFKAKSGHANDRIRAEADWLRAETAALQHKQNKEAQGKSTTKSSKPQAQEA
jgi:hypothetical protein